MPHRRGLGEQATDARAVTLLGRLVLAGILEPELGVAGETYLAHWHGYLFTIAGPQAFANGSNLTFTCDGCPEPIVYCRCWMRRKIYAESRRILLTVKNEAYTAVWHTVICDRPAHNLEALRLGLIVLAQHYGLLSRKNANSNNVSIPKPAS